MMHGASARVWETIGPLAFIQFPWRFFLLVSIGGGVLVALLVSGVPDRRLQAVVVLLLVAAHVHLYQRRLRTDRYLPIAGYNIDDRAWGLSDDARRVAHDEASYDPIGVVRDPSTRGRWSVSGGATTVAPLGVSETQLILQTAGRSWSVVRLHTPWFPGWRVRIDDEETPFERAPGTGYMDVRVPPGRHVVDARFVNTPVRAAANVVSTLSGVLIAVLAMQAHRAPGDPYEAAGIDERAPRFRLTLSPSCRSTLTSVRFRCILSGWRARRPASGRRPIVRKHYPRPEASAWPSESP